MPSKKIYCYVDETGQDTQGKLFIVSVILTAESQDQLADYLTELEVNSGKGKIKWGRASSKQKLNFVSEIFSSKKVLNIRVCYSCYKNTKDYKNSTVLTIAKSINTLHNFSYKNYNIYVDGLSKKDEKYFGTQIHHLGIHTKKVRGVKKDENNPMIRLADSMCGFVRDVLEGGNKDLKLIYDRAVKKGELYEI